MKIRLLAFASAADALGAAELELELPADATLGMLRLALEARFPALKPHWPRLAVAVNGVVAGSAEPLREGAEVALLPPVSGGTEDVSPEDVNGRVRLVENPIDPQALLAQVAAHRFGAGVLFVGTVRETSKTDTSGAPSRLVLHLTYTAYRPMALAALHRIASDLEASGGLRMAIVHRLGRVAVGEASVAIAAAAPHRAAAFEASRIALERLKSEVPIWKLERYVDGESLWREEEPLRASPESLEA